MVSREAVIAPDGFSYARPEIEAWRDDPRSRQRSPMTGVPLVPNPDRIAQHRALLAYPRLVRLIAAAEKDALAPSAPYLTERERKVLWQVGHPGPVVPPGLLLWEARAALEALGRRQVPDPDPDNAWAVLVAGYRALQQLPGAPATGPAEDRLRTLARLGGDLSEERLRRDSFLIDLAVQGSVKPRRPEGPLEDAHPKLVDAVKFDTAERPVVASDGHIYDVETIAALCVRGQPSSHTREPLDSEVYVHRAAEETIGRFKGRGQRTTAATATLITAESELPGALRRQGALEEGVRSGAFRASELVSPSWWVRNGCYVGAAAGLTLGAGLIGAGARMRHASPAVVHTELGDYRLPPPLYGVGSALAALGALAGLVGILLAAAGIAASRRRAREHRDATTHLGQLRQSLAETRAKIAQLEHDPPEPQPAPGGGPKPLAAAVMAAARAVERADAAQADADRVEAWLRAHPPPADLPGAIARPSAAAHPAPPDDGRSAPDRPTAAFEIEIVIPPEHDGQGPGAAGARAARSGLEASPARARAAGPGLQASPASGSSVERPAPGSTHGPGAAPPEDRYALREIVVDRGPVDPPPPAARTTTAPVS